MTNLLTLAAQIEQATEGQQREMLEAAWHEIHRGGYGPEGSWDTCRKCDQFKAMLAAKAYESAAMMLVPEGLSYEVRRSGTGDKGQATIWNPMCVPGDPSEVRVVGCSAPALALAAACCRAMAQMGEG